MVYLKEHCTFFRWCDQRQFAVLFIQECGYQWLGTQLSRWMALQSGRGRGQLHFVQAINTLIEACTVVFSSHGSKGVYWVEGVDVFVSSFRLLEGHCAQWRKSGVAFFCLEDTCVLIRNNRLAVVTSQAVSCVCPT